MLDKDSSEDNNLNYSEKQSLNSSANLKKAFKKQTSLGEMKD